MCLLANEIHTRIAALRAVCVPQELAGNALAHYQIITLAYCAPVGLRVVNIHNIPGVGGYGEVELFVQAMRIAGKEQETAQP